VRGSRARTMVAVDAQPGEDIHKPSESRLSEDM